jgi:NTP pyrophosphatase (non-canonical NTP hydrolase)
MNLKDLVDGAYETAKSKGWHDVPATFGDRIALVHSEASEALEAYRENNTDAFGPFEKLFRSAVTGNLTRAKFEFVVEQDEFGLPKEVLKMNKPEGVWSELADVVIRVADMCGLYGINLEEAVTAKMEFNKTRSYRHGGKKL